MTENVQSAYAPRTNAVRLRHFTTRLYGLSQPPPYQDRGIPFVRATNVERGKLVRNGLAFVSEGDLPESRAIRLVEGDIIVVRSGAYTGDSALVTADWAGGVAGFDIVVRVDRYGDPRFVAYSLLSPQVLQGQIDPMRSRAAQPHLNAEELGNVVLALPPMECQRAIADYLDRETARLDALVAVKERLLGLLAEKRRALITHAVTRGLDPAVRLRDSGVPWLGEIPAHWTRCHLKRLLASSDYGISTAVEPSGDIAVLRMGDIRGGEVDFSGIGFVDEVDDALLLREEDLVFNRTNSLDQIGKVALFRGTTAYPVSFASYLVRFRCGPNVMPEFLNWLLNSAFPKAWGRAEALPAIGQANLNPNRYGYLPIALPPLFEQRQIAQYISEAVSTIDAVQQSARRTIALLKERRSALIAAAATGQLDLGSAA